MIYPIWRLSEYTPDNLGLACTDDGLLLGHTALIERRDGRFVVRERFEIEGLFKCAFPNGFAVDRLTAGLATVASALNANDPALARIAAVHLKIPDLPSPAARDALIKYARDEGGSNNWNPALHPRSGVPPNPGWFAPTGGPQHGSSQDESRPGESRLRFVENQDDSRRTDAAPPHDGWVTLPPGEYNDELADFIQWIANAKPEDARTIRAEIKRYYYDVGDANGGDALNAILSAVLQPGITKEERQTNLNLAAHYAKYDPALAGRLRDLLSGTLLLLSPWLFRGPLPKLPAVPPEIEFETAAIAVPAQQRLAIWKLGPFPRGKVIDKLFRSGDLHELSRTIDDFVDNIAISNKSVDLNAATYQDFQRLLYKLNKYLTELEAYSGTRWGGDVIVSSEISGKVLRLIIPESSLTAVQREAIKAATRIARSKNIRIIVTIF